MLGTEGLQSGRACCPFILQVGLCPMLRQFKSVRLRLLMRGALWNTHRHVPWRKDEQRWHECADLWQPSLAMGPASASCRVQRLAMRWGTPFLCAAPTMRTCCRAQRRHGCSVPWKHAHAGRPGRLV